MSNMTTEQQQFLNDQVRRWKKELKHIAGQIAAAEGKSCALVLITGTDEDYADVHPQLVLEDAMRINPHGWPNGFSFELLNTDD